jgi:hypothetical protein
MPVSLKDLGKALLEILGWHEVWDAYDWIKQSRWGQRMIAVVGAMVVGVFVYATQHPPLIYVAVGMFIGSLATRIVSWLLLRRRGASIDWYAFSFQLPTQNSGLWLTGLTRPEPFVAFKFMVTNATKKPVEITGINGIININGPCNAPARLTSFQTQGIKFRPQIETYEITIEQPVTATNASNIIETLKRKDGFVRFGFSEVQLTGTVALDTDRIVALENCYLDRTSRGTVGMGIGVRGPIDLITSPDEQLGRPEPCFVSQRIYDDQGRLRSENGNSN